MKLILFDIDRTLIGRSKCHHAAFSYAFKKVYNVDVVYNTDIDINLIDYAGMTDPQIIIEVLKKKGLTEDTIKTKMNECTETIIDYFKKNVNHDNIPILEGVKELLEELNKQNVIMGLVTGNLEPIAREKLKNVGLNHYFKVGAFGSDNINKTVLVKIAIKRAAENFNFKGNDVFVVGDTIRDINAGLKANVKAIGVATGNYSKEELKASGANFVLNDLSSVDEILKIIKE